MEGWKVDANNFASTCCGNKGHAETTCRRTINEAVEVES
ncbi:MAG: hypothetical protein ACI9XK_000422 [Granulosicoccus sp.]|jgi:hypothetical protein